MAGLALLCPGLVSQKAAGPLQRVLLRVAHRTPLRSRHVKIPLQDPALFTKDPHWQSFVAEDPLALRTITIRCAWENVRLTQYATGAPAEIISPTLLVLAADDAIVDNVGIRALVDQFTTSGRQVTEYAEASHTLEFEADPQTYFDDVAKWALALEANREA